MKYKTILFLMMFFQCVFAQETSKTTVRASEITALFSQKSSVEWAIPISQTEKLTLQWSERKSSFTEKEGIRSFVGYQGDQFVATLSISKNNLVSGNVQQGNEEIQLNTTKNGFISITKNKVEGTCGTCANGHCESTHQHTNTSLKTVLDRSVSTQSYLAKTLTSTQPTYDIITDGIYREYRLAVFVDYNYFRYNFHYNVDNVKTFWSRIEVLLNEIYTRDIGIKFIVLKDEKLIAKYSQKYNGRTALQVSNSGTRDINALINTDSYDVGIILTNITGNVRGLSDLSGAFIKKNKANSVAINDNQTIIHEIGHLLGAIHTFTDNVTVSSSSSLTEPNSGTSIMGYGNLRKNFFSLPSVQRIRENIFNKGGYIENRDTKKLVGKLGGENHPYGKKTDNKAPVIDQSKLKRNYQIPTGTYFQFAISATDPDGHQLRYAAHQADIGQKNKAKFSPKQSSEDNLVTYQERHYTPNTYTFWLGVNDQNTTDQYHATRYDMYETKVEFVNGTAFKISNPFHFLNKTYSVGQKVPLTWGVDNILKPYKVRILLTDANGKTKQVLVASTDNDGSEEIVMPNKVSNDNRIKIEVLDHIAYDINEHNFTITNSEITFQNLPKPNIVVNDKSEIKQENITATSTCHLGNTTTVTPEQKENGNFVIRTWTAKDKCNNTATFVQNIEIVPSHTSLAFVLPLPENKTIDCSYEPSKDIVEKVEVTGGNNPTIHLTEYKNSDNEGLTYIKRTWTATDGVSEPISHTQIITFSGRPKLSDYPQDIVVNEESKVPQQQELTATQCSANINVFKQQRKYNQNGKIIYERTWTAGQLPNYEYHTQIITVDPSYTPPVQEFKFTKTPNENISAVCKAPDADYKQFATSGCDAEVTYSHQDTPTGGTCNYTITRVYTAMGCGKSINFTQTITVKDDVKPTFNNPPADITVQEGNVPEQETLTATDNCKGSVAVVQLPREEITEGNNRVVIYKWKATDSCGNEEVHTQRIKVEKGLSAVTHIVDNVNKPLLYPNPVSNVFYLNNIKDIVSVSIYNEEGRLIKTFEKSQSSYDVSNLKTGNYILRVHTKNENINIKWIKL